MCSGERAEASVGPDLHGPDLRPRGGRALLLFGPRGGQ